MLYPAQFTQVCPHSFWYLQDNITPVLRAFWRAPPRPSQARLHIEEHAFELTGMILRARLLALVVSGWTLRPLETAEIPQMLHHLHIQQYCDTQAASNTLTHVLGTLRSVHDAVKALHNNPLPIIIIIILQPSYCSVTASPQNRMYNTRSTYRNDEKSTPGPNIASESRHVDALLSLFMSASLLLPPSLLLLPLRGRDKDPCRENSADTSRG